MSAASPGRAALMWVTRWARFALSPRPPSTVPPPPRDPRPLVDAGIPSRLDVGAKDPSERDRARLFGPEITVLLDGDVQRFVVAFDVEAGWLLRYQVDEAGKVKVDRARAEALAERVRGRVEVRWRDGPGGAVESLEPSRWTPAAGKKTCISDISSGGKNGGA